MIHRALRVEERLRLFVRDDRYRRDLQNDALSDADWEHLQQVAIALKPFHDTTQRMQGSGEEGHHGCIWEAIPALEGLLTKMEKGTAAATSNQRSRPTPLEIAHQNAWEKLRKYYSLTDVCPEIYGAGLLLHPCHRRTYFDLSWKDNDMQPWKERLLTSVRATWETEYCAASTDISDNKRLEEPLANRQKRQRSPDLIDQHLKDLYANARPAESNSNFDTYIAGAISDPSDVPNVIAWWAKKEPRTPLAQLALNVLSIPAMSTECERLFSSTARLVGTTRFSLRDDTMEALELLR